MGSESRIKSRLQRCVRSWVCIVSHVQWEVCGVCWRADLLVEQLLHGQREPDERLQLSVHPIQEGLRPGRERGGRVIRQVLAASAASRHTHAHTCTRAITLACAHPSSQPWPGPCSAGLTLALDPNLARTRARAP